MIRKSYSFEFDGKTNNVYTLTNGKGSEVDILNYGARIISVRIKNERSLFNEFVLGPKKVEDYHDKKFSYHGAMVGRYANRIGEARFCMDNKEYLLDVNQKGHCLHGGYSGFHNKLWEASENEKSLVLSCISPDGEGGFPGELKVSIKYTLTEEDSLIIEYNALSDKNTHCNFTNHTYFTFDKKDTRNFLAYINSDKITAMDEDFVVRGGFVDISNTAYSFNPKKLIGKDILDCDYHMEKRSGYDVNYCINKKTERDLELCAYVYDQTSGRKIECYSTLPGLQFYTTKNVGKIAGEDDGLEYTAFCLEPQYYPNTVNCKDYPSTLLKKGQPFAGTIVYKFSVCNKEDDK